MVDASGVNWHLRLTWLSLLRVVLIERPHGLHQITYFGKEDWMDRTQERRSSWLKPHWLKLPLWFGHSLHSTKPRGYPIAALLGPWIGTLLWPTGALRGHRDYVNTHH